VFGIVQHAGKGLEREDFLSSGAHRVALDMIGIAGNVDALAKAYREVGNSLIE
jgi:hypothetical protein